jgi:hypothetical protein
VKVTHVGVFNVPFATSRWLWERGNVILLEILPNGNFGIRNELSTQPYFVNGSNFHKALSHITQIDEFLEKTDF